MREKSAIDSSRSRRTNIIYTNPLYFEDENSNINYTKILRVIDSITEIKNVNKNHDILIRVESDLARANCNFNLKFGANTEEAYKIMEEADKYSVNIKGISFHIGSGGDFSRRDAYFNTYNSNIRLLEKIHQTVEKPILNFGGGLLYDTDLEESLGWTKNLPFEMIAEPGRYFSQPSYHLVVKVIAKTRRGLYIDNGVYHELNVYHRDYWKFPLLINYIDNKGSITDVLNYKQIMIFGPTCDNYDNLGMCYVPENINVGDFIFFPHMGAYTTAGMVEFNGINGASSF
jgi:ornithine decarboxylase